MTKPSLTRWFFAGVALAAAFVASRACSQVVMYEFESADCVACKSPEFLATLAQLRAEGVDVRPADIAVYGEAFDKVRHPGYPRSVPQFVVTSGNQVVTRAVGVQSIETLRAMWQKGLASAKKPSQPPPGSPQASVCRVLVQSGSITDAGSGVIVSPNVVLTNWHVLRDATSGSNLTVAFADQTGAPVTRVLGVDQALDLAALEVHTAHRPALELADGLPPTGAPIVAAGSVHGVYQEYAGQVAGYAGLGSPPEFLQVTTSRPVRQGDSGGPLVDGRGKLVGVLFGQRDNLVHGANCCRVRDFLRRVLGRDPKPSLPATFTPPVQQPATTQAPQADPPAKLEPLPTKPSEMQQPAAPVVEVPSTPTSSESIGATCPAPPASEAATPKPEPAAASPSVFTDLLGSAAKWALTRGLVSVGVPGGAAAVGASAALWFVRWRRKRRAAKATNNEVQESAAVPAASSKPASPSAKEKALEAENKSLREQLATTQQAVIYASPPVGDNLPRMRHAMQLGSDRRPECRKWVRFFEDIYKQLLGGEINAGSDANADR